MITLARPAQHAQGATVFADHADPSRFYYLADTPRLRLKPDGKPELTLLKYRLDPQLHAQLGAGLLAMTVDLGLPEERLARLRARVAATAGLSRTTLEPVAPTGGSATLALIDRVVGDVPGEGSAMVQRLLGASAPSMYGELSTTFMAVLSAEGVSMVESALLGGGLPAGVVYHLDVPVLRPSLRARITARWQDAYAFFEDRLHGGKLLLAVDIGPTAEELVRAEVMKVEIDELVPAGEQEEVHRRALEDVQRYILQELFTPTLGTAPPPPDPEGDALTTIGTAIKDIAGFFSFTFSLRDIERSELKTMSYDLAVARAETLPLAPQGTFPVLLEGLGATAAGLVVEVEPAASPEMPFDFGLSRALAPEAIERVDVTVRYDGREERLALTDETPRAPLTFWYDAQAGAAVEYRYDVSFDASGAGTVAPLAAAPRLTAERVVRIDPRELYRPVSIRCVCQGVPFDRYPKVIVDVSFEEPGGSLSHQATLELGADRPEDTAVVRTGLETTVLIRRRIRYVAADGREQLVDWDVVQPGTLIVGDPAPEIVDVEILGSARFGTAVQRLIVELRPHAAPDRVEVRTLTAQEPSARWSWAPPAGADRGYDYRVTVHTAAAEVREGQWLPGVPGKLVVGEGIARLRTVRLVFVGKTQQELGLLGVKVRFSFADQQAGLIAEEERMVTDLRTPLEWTYPVADPERQAYTFQTTLIRGDGTQQPLDAVTTTDLLAIQPVLA